MYMKKITSIIIFILTISLIFIVYLVIKNPKDENIYINIPLGESRKINDLNEEILVTKIDRELDEKLTQSIENGQREFILKEKLKEINSELGITKENEIASLKEKLSSLSLEEKTYNKLLNEINKYSTCSEFSPEAAVIKNYLDTVLNLPWKQY